MFKGLQAGFDDAIAPLNVLEDFSVQVSRCDVTDAINLEQVVKTFEHSLVRPLFLIRDVSVNERLLNAALPVLGNSNYMIEVFNEPNYNDISVETFVDGVNAVRNDCRARGFLGPIITGGIGNLNQDSISYLERAAKKFPSDVVVGFHRYQPGTQIGLDGENRRNVPWFPFHSREEELAKLHEIAGARDIACTEFGYHTAEEEVLGKKVRMTNEQCRDNLIADFELYNNNGVLLATVYQWTDGPNDEFMHRFGMVTVEGTPKPQFDAFKVHLQ